MAPPAVHPLPPALSGERLRIDGRAGALSYYVAGDGPPLLLIHSINAAASAYEVKPVFEAMAATHRVYAPDLPGYGHSDRSDRPYTVPLFCAAVADMVDRIGQEHPGRPLDALAVSLSAEFLARVAVDQPDRFRTLTLVTPTGFNRGADRLRRPGTREIRAMGGFLNLAGIGKGLFGLLVTRGSIRYFLKRTFGADDVPPALVDYAHATANQPGAHHAPFAFLSGRLFSTDIRTVYEGLGLPVWLPHATRGDFRDFTEAGWATGRPSWRVQPWQAGALMYFERPDAFLDDFRRFLDSPPTR